jgi:hypothetical protein
MPPTCPSLFLLGLLTLIIFGEEQNLRSSSLCKYGHFLSLRRKCSPHHVVVKHPSFNVKEQVLNSYKTTDKVIVLYTSIFTFWNSRWEDKIFRTNGSKHPPSLIRIFRKCNFRLLLSYVWTLPHLERFIAIVICWFCSVFGWWHISIRVLSFLCLHLDPPPYYIQAHCGIKESFCISLCGIYIFV